MERTVFVDPGKSRRRCRVRPEGAASTPLPAIILESDEKLSNPQVRQPSHSDDAIHRAVVWDDFIGRTCFRCVAARRSLLIQPKVSAIFVIVADVLINQSLQMASAQNDHMVEQISTAGGNPTLSNTVLPWTSETCPLGLDAEALYSVDDFLIEVCAAIEDQITECSASPLLNHIKC